MAQGVYHHRPTLSLFSLGIPINRWGR